MAALENSRLFTRIFLSSDGEIPTALQFIRRNGSAQGILAFGDGTENNPYSFPAGVVSNSKHIDEFFTPLTQEEPPTDIFFIWNCAVHVLTPTGNSYPTKYEVPQRK